jgi:hypothetical protein
MECPGVPDDSFYGQLQQSWKQKAVDLEESTEANLVGVSEDRVGERTLPPVLHALLREQPGEHRKTEGSAVLLSPMLNHD